MMMMMMNTILMHGFVHHHDAVQVSHLKMLWSLLSTIAFTACPCFTAFQLLRYILEKLLEFLWIWVSKLEMML